MIHTKIGATIYNVSTKGKFKEFIQELYDYGFRIFELYLPFYSVVNSDSTINKTKVNEIKDVLSTFKTEELSAHGYYDDEVNVISNPASVDETTRKMAEKTLLSTLEICSELNVHVLNEHPGTILPELKKSNSINVSFMVNNYERLGKPNAVKAAVRTIENCAKAAEDNDVLICVENEVPRVDTLPIADNPLVIPTIVDAVGSEYVRATCDVGHLALSASFFGFDLLTSIRLLKPYIRHLHLHDNRLIPFPVGGTKLEKDLGDLHLPPGKGLIDFKGAIKCLDGVDAVYNLEVIRYKTLADFKLSADFLRKLQSS
ncbi:MAG: sugar phosphate isomerase/epimerase [Candidatus Atabeyarchaeum deiterrae]